MAASYQLISVVQDLHDLYQRLAPGGPYRLPLFAALEAPAPALPEVLLAETQAIDEQVRGVTCLLGNALPAASLSVCTQLWRLVRRFEQQWLLPASPAPQYYAYLSAELEQREADAAAQAYRLFGEVLSVYVDVLCQLGIPGTNGVAPAVAALRRRLAQAGADSSSAGGMGGSAPPAP